MPLSCVDRPHALRPDRAGYLDDITYARRRDFEHERAFYGCWDWHSAVNSTWAMVRLMKEVPDLSVAPLIREKLRDHLSEAAMEGELQYLTDNPSFERPYGWAWLLLLHAEFASWDDPDAGDVGRAADPGHGPGGGAAGRLPGGAGDTRADRRAPEHGLRDRHGPAGHGNGRAPRTGGRSFRDAAVRFFAADRGCPTAYEPGRSDFVSPCLEEAALMAMVMEQAEYVPWLGNFLPPIDSDDFANLRNPAPAGPADAPPSEGGAVITNDSLRAALGARSHLIGLAFTRAEAMLRIANALPTNDPRAQPIRALASEHARAGFDTMFDADYAGSHWIGSFAVKYLVQATKGSIT